MDTKKIAQNLKKFLVDRDISNTDVSKAFGCSEAYISGMLNGQTSIAKKTAQKWADIYGVSASYLLTGDGSIDGSSIAPSNVIMIPHINLDARGGIASNEVTDTEQYITERIPFATTIARDGDFAMTIYGESMSPTYPSGSIVLVRPIDRWRDYLELGAPYIIELEDGRRLCKVISAGDDTAHYLLQSVNPQYQASQVPVAMICHVARVLACLKRESI